MRKIIVLSALWVLFAATTYVLKENGVEVGRMDENNGKNDVQVIEGSAGPGSPEIPKPSQPRIIEQNSRWLEGRRGYLAALDRQKINGEPVMLYFYATWCPYCREFEKNILENRKVKTGLSRISKVKMDAEKESGIAEKYEVDAYPRVYVVNAKGVKYRVNTSVTPEEFLNSCRNKQLKIFSE